MPCALEARRRDVETKVRVSDCVRSDSADVTYCIHDIYPWAEFDFSIQLDKPRRD